MDKNAHEVKKPTYRDYGTAPSPTEEDTRDEQEGRGPSAVFTGALSFCGTLFALIFGIFTILAWQVSIEAYNSAQLQNQVALLQYCVPNVRIFFIRTNFISIRPAPARTEQCRNKNMAHTAAKYLARS